MSEDAQVWVFWVGVVVFVAACLVFGVQPARQW